MRTALPIALVMTLVACHQARLGPAPSRRVGDYAFRISLSGQDPVRGSFTIAPDTVLLETAGEACRVVPAQVRTQNLLAFSCFPPPGLDAFGITIDPNHPSLSKWSAMQSVMKTRTVCARVTTTPQGRQVCAETRRENYFENVRTGGTLSLTAVDTVGRR
jgi:hypothetical protein